MNALDDIFLLLLYIGGFLVILIPAAIVGDWLEARHRRRSLPYRLIRGRRGRP